MNSAAGVVRQIAIDVDRETVIIELICADAYGAQVLNDDIVSRLKSDHVLSLIVKVGAQVEDEAKA